MREREKWWLSVSQIIQYCYDEYWIKSLCLFLQPLPSDILTRRVGILEVGVLPINSFRPFDQSTATATTKPEYSFLYIGRFQFRYLDTPIMSQFNATSSPDAHTTPHQCSPSKKYFRAMEPITPEFKVKKDSKNIKNPTFISRRSYPLPSLPPYPDALNYFKH